MRCGERNEQSVTHKKGALFYLSLLQLIESIRRNFVGITDTECIDDRLLRINHERCDTVSALTSKADVAVQAY